jgi:hypothetical protein
MRFDSLSLPKQLGHDEYDQDPDPDVYQDIIRHTTRVPDLTKGSRRGPVKQKQIQKQRYERPYMIE